MKAKRTIMLILSLSILLTAARAEEVTLSFQPEWNIFALPLQPVTQITADNLCKNVPACTAVGFWDTNSQMWNFHYVDRPDVNNFVLEPKRGYSLIIDKDKYTGSSAVKIAGTKPSGTQTLELKKGINAIGWFATSSRLIPKAMASLKGKFSAVIRWKVPNGPDPINEYYYFDYRTDGFTELEPGLGYLIDVDEDKTWTYDAETAGDAYCYEFIPNAQWVVYCQQLGGTIDISSGPDGCAEDAKCSTECSKNHCEICSEDECGKSSTSGYCKPLYANFTENGQTRVQYSACLQIKTDSAQTNLGTQDCSGWQPDSNWVIECSKAGGTVKITRGVDGCPEKAQCVLSCSKESCSGCSEFDCGVDNTSASCKPIYANFMEDNKITKRFVACVQTQSFGDALGASSGIRCTADSECAGAVCSEGDTKCIDGYCTCISGSGVDPLVTASKKLDEVKRNLEKMELMSGAIRDYLKTINDPRVQIWSSIDETIKADIQKVTELQTKIREENANPTQTGRNAIRLEVNQLINDVDSIMTLMMS